MSFTNAQLAQKISDLIEYWSSFNEEYSNWLGGTVGGGPGSDGKYPLTDWTGNEALVESPAKLADNVSGYVGTVAASATAAAASATAAATSESNASTSATTATTQAALADVSRIAAELAETGAVDAKVIAIAQQIIASAKAVITTADAVITNADVVLTNADVVLSGLDVGYAAEWAIKVEDSLISAAAGGNQSSDYSALHWAAKAATFNPNLYALLTGAVFSGKIQAPTGGSQSAPQYTFGGRTDVGIYSNASATMSFTVGADRQMFIEALKVTIDNELIIAGTASGTQPGQWDTAYGWGDHASGGYASLTGDQSFNGVLSLTKNGVEAIVFDSTAGPIGIRWDSGDSNSVNISLNYRTTPDTLQFERVSDGADILMLDPSDLSVTIGGALSAVSYNGVLAANLLDKSADETITGKYTFTNTGGMVIGDGDSADGEVLLKFNTDRAWQFMVTGEGSAAALVLRALSNGKEFKIQDATAKTQFRFLTEASAPSLRMYDGSGVDYAHFNHDGTDFNTSFGGTTDWNITVTNLKLIGAFSATGVVTGSNLNVANWDTAYGWGDHASGGYAALAGSYDQDFKVDVLQLQNIETAEITVGGELGYDANDSSAPASLGTFASTNPLGLYINDSGSLVSRIYHTGHFSGTHIANWQTAYGWGNHTGGGYLTSSTGYNQVSARDNETDLDTWLDDSIHHPGANNDNYPSGVSRYGTLMSFDNSDVQSQIYIDRNVGGSLYFRANSSSTLVGIAWNRGWSDADFDITDYALLGSSQTVSGVWDHTGVLSVSDVDFYVREAGALKFHVDVSVDRVLIRDGYHLRVQDAGDTDYMEFYHNGADSYLTHFQTNWWRVDGLTSGVLFLNGIEIRTYSAANSAYVTMDHNATDGRITVSAGALRLYAAAGGKIYLQEDVYMGGDSIGHFEPVSGNYGSVQVDGADGSSGTWKGYSINGEWVFMSSGGAAGIYDDVNNNWLINVTANGGVDLRYNNSVKLASTNAGVSITGNLAVSGTLASNSLAVPAYITAGYTSGKISVGSSAPGSPAKGDIWFDTT